MSDRGRLDAIHRLRDILGITDLTHIVDIGASAVEGPPPYQILCDAGICDLVAFEPQTHTLPPMVGKVRHLPYVVGDGQMARFHHCSHSGWTSTLRPAQASLNVFTQYIKNATVTKVEEVSTSRLDDLDDVPEMDVLKIDIQGGELKALQNGRKKMAKALFVHIEVSFFPLYEDQPAFGEIDLELREQGFLLHTLREWKPAIIPPMQIDNDPWRTLHQILDGDAIYVRDLRHCDSWTARQLRHTALVAHCCYGSWDLAARMVDILIRRGELPATSMEAYFSLIRGRQGG